MKWIFLMTICWIIPPIIYPYKVGQLESFNVIQIENMAAFGTKNVHSAISCHLQKVLKIST